MTDNNTYQPFKTVLLSDQGVTLGEYIERLLCSDNVPAAIIMSEANISLMSDVPSIEMLVSTDETVDDLERKQTPVQSISSGIVLSGDASFDDNTLLLTYAKRADTQGISGASIMEEVGKLFGSDGIKTDNTAKQEVNAYLQNLEDNGFFKDDK